MSSKDFGRNDGNPLLSRVLAAGFLHIRGNSASGTKQSIEDRGKSTQDGDSLIPAGLLAEHRPRGENQVSSQEFQRNKIMATDIKMPQLSDTMQSGKIIKWNKKEGDSVKRGDSLAEVETEKANLDVEAFQEGVLLKIFVQENESADVGQIIAMIGSPGENVEGPHSTSPHDYSAGNQRMEGPVAPSETSPQAAQTVSAPDDASNRIKASPLARRLAEERHIDLRSIDGTGPEGRIVRKDVEQAPSLRKRTLAERGPSEAAEAVEGDRVLTPSRMRETIAARMQQSAAEIPHFFATVTINMRNALSLQLHLKQRSEFEGISINHLVIKAAACALSHEPRVNSNMREGRIVQPGSINIGIVTAVDDGLLIPVVRDADKLSMKDLVFEARAAVERARAGRPNSTDLTGGTFSISNMGMFEISHFTALINPGQGAILAVGSVQEEPVVEAGQVVPGKIMRVTLSSDHRVIDGVAAAGFLKHFKQVLEIPSLLFI